MFTDCFRHLFSKTSPKPDSLTVLQKAEAGNADAQFAMGLKLSMGKETHDQSLAANWYRQAALQNHRLAQHNLGIMLSRGQGIVRNEHEAGEWLSRAAYGGDAGAQFQMGQRLSRATVDQLGVEANDIMIEAYKWFQLAAGQGYKASAAHAERMTFRMAVEDVREGNQRVSTFVPTLS